MSVVFAGAASLPIGLEDPLIFIGLAIGHNIQRFVLPRAYPTLHLEGMQRDLAVVGCACGVSGAFLTPIGGVLFAMEEGASFWSPLLAWRSFASACLTTIAMYIFQWLWFLVANGGGDIQPDQVFFKIHSMEVYSGLPGQRRSRFDIGVNVTTDGLTGSEIHYRSQPGYRFYDFVFFAAIGILAGIVGALWIEGSVVLSRFRRRIDLHRAGKVAEILGLTLLVSCVLWFLPRVYTRCNPRESSGLTDDSILRQLNCPDGQYNQLGTLFLNGPGNIGLNLLYWEPAQTFDPVVLLLAGSTYHVLLLLLFGSTISMGIFVPLLYMGACYGRAISILATRHMEFDESDRRDHMVFTFTMVSSVAVLAGVARVLISLSVIMICSIGTTYLLTPFMVATLFAKIVGKAVSGRPGIYDVVLEMRVRIRKNLLRCEYRFNSLVRSPHSLILPGSSACFHVACHNPCLYLGNRLSVVY